MKKWRKMKKRKWKNEMKKNKMKKMKKWIFWLKNPFWNCVLWSMSKWSLRIFFFSFSNMVMQVEWIFMSTLNDFCIDVMLSQRKRVRKSAVISNTSLQKVRNSEENCSWFLFDSVLQNDRHQEMKINGYLDLVTLKKSGWLICSSLSTARNPNNWKDSCVWLENSKIYLFWILSNG